MNSRDRLHKIDNILKISHIHSLETGISGLKDEIDLINEIDIQLKRLNSLAHASYRRGLTPKQLGLLKGTVEELRVKFKYLDSELRDKYYQQYSNIGLYDLLLG